MFVALRAEVYSGEPTEADKGEVLFECNVTAPSALMRADGYEPHMQPASDALYELLRDWLADRPNG